MDPQLAPNPDSAAALEHHIDAMLRAWRGRVTEKASTSMMGILIRHLGAAGAARMFGEWKGMSASERFNLLKQTGGVDDPPPALKTAVVEALRDESFEVRGAALDALQELGAPVGELEIVAPDDVEQALPALRRWAAETDS
jgi:hypothetical protein